MMAMKKVQLNARTKKTTARKPPQALLADMQKLFVKHNWYGSAIGRVSVRAVAGCPGGTTPHEITYQLPDGTWVTKTVCLPNAAAAESSLPGEPGTDDELAPLAGDPGTDDL
jgi:hypothetical protein